MAILQKVVGWVLVAWLAITGCSVAEAADFDLAAQLVEAELDRDPSVKSVNRIETNQLKVQLTDGSEVDVFLDNLSAELRSSEEDPEAIAARFARIAVASAGKPLQIEQKRIYPIVRHISYLTQFREIYGEKADLPAGIPLAADYLVLVALDREESMRILRESDFSEIGNSQDEVLALAVENLRRDLTPKAEILGDGQINMVAMGGNYESSLLLDNEFWRSEAKRMDDSPVAVAAARDLLLYVRKSDEESIARMRKIVDENQATMTGPISTQLLEWTGDNWRPFDQ